MRVPSSSTNPRRENSDVEVFIIPENEPLLGPRVQHGSHPTREAFDDNPNKNVEDGHGHGHGKLCVLC
jgi:hypothetical protein